MNNTSEARVYKIERMRKVLRCDRCPPNRKENAKRNARRSWKLRTRRVRQYNEDL